MNRNTYSAGNKKLIDKLLNDMNFRRIACADIGGNVKVRVDWEKDRIVLTGDLSVRTLSISETLDTIKNGVTVQ